MTNWYDELPFAITVSDKEGKIIFMNNRSASTFEKYGGRDLLGKSLFGCHPPQASEKIREMLESHETNAYTIDKNGQKKLIYQSPWYENGEFAGLIELSLVLPENMPHFVRK
ncbi:MAG: PAS domain-containing protein [Bacteroidales bacterium]|jgi:DUF438 domain-containing protein|nr:PAS domain-containing protein [Bacteroidales bacterium]HPE99845.1 PAS domain-containing protein [Bacteroidales bacterium]